VGVSVGESIGALVGDALVVAAKTVLSGDFLIPKTDGTSKRRVKITARSKPLLYQIKFLM
jgi:hypothetical protein